MKNIILGTIIFLLLCSNVLFGLISFDVINPPWRNDELKFFGVVQSWDPASGRVVAVRADGATQEFGVDPDKMELIMITTNEQNIEVRRKQVTSRDSEDWPAYFCMGEKIFLETRLNRGQKIYQPFAVTSIGLGTCR